VDGRVKPGHDEKESLKTIRESWLHFWSHSDERALARVSKDEIAEREDALITARDADGLVSAVASGNGDGFGRAARHVGPVGRGDRRRISMRPIPGDILRIGVVHVARCRLRSIRDRSAIRWPVEEVSITEPDAASIVSAVMPERPRQCRAGNRMRGSKPAAMRYSGLGEGLVRRKHERYCTEARDHHPVNSIRHRTHHWLVAKQQSNAMPGLLSPQMHN
jgi:hypothetical protein